MKKLLLGILLFPLVEGQAQWVDKNEDVDADIKSVSYIDNNTGIVVGRFGKVYHTSDGGETWVAQNSASSNDLNGVFMLDESHAWAVGDDGTIVKFDGSSWTSYGSGETRDVMAVEFIDSDNGWAVGDFGRLYHSSDGGETWSNQNNDALRTNKYYGVSMISESLGYAAGTSGRIVKYNGNNWSNESGTGTTDYFAIDFLNEDFGFAVGKQNKIYHFNGTSWSEHNSGLSGNYNLNGVKIIDENLAYVCGNSGTASGDGLILKYDGSSWSIDYQNTDGLVNEAFESIDFYDQNNGLAVGTGSLIKVLGDNTTGVHDVAHTDEADIFPNPFTSGFSLNLPHKSEITNLWLTNISGKKIESFNPKVNPSNHSFYIDASGLPGGVYLFHYTVDEKPLTKKLIKAF